MELWIRTQDGKRLIKSNGVALSTSGLSIYPIDANGVLGTYETEERALEVLDEIQSKLTLNCYIDNASWQEMDLIVKGKLLEAQYDVIYEMPEE